MVADFVAVDCSTRNPTIADRSRAALRLALNVALEAATLPSNRATAVAPIDPDDDPDSSRYV